MPGQYPGIGRAGAVLGPAYFKSCRGRAKSGGAYGTGVPPAAFSARPGYRPGFVPGVWRYNPVPAGPFRC